MSVRPWAACLLLLLGVPFLAGQAKDSTEEACTEELETVIIPRFVANRYAGAEEREGVLDLLEPLRQQHQDTAPVCIGRGVEQEMLLHILNDRPAEAVRVADAFLEGSGRFTSMRSRINITKERGYALIHMGELREGAQSYYAAAALADQTEVQRGAWILIASAFTARSLGDLHTAQRYLTHAQTMLRQASAERGPDAELAYYRSQALVYEAMLTHDRLKLNTEGPSRDSLALHLEQQGYESLQALDELVGYGDHYYSTILTGDGFRALATNMYALAAAYRGEYDVANERLAASYPAARRGREAYPIVLLETHLTRATIARLEGDADGEREATELAYQEAVDLGESGHEATALETFGRLAEDAGAWDEAARYYRQAIDLRERQRERIGLQDWSASVFSEMQNGYRGLARTHLAVGRTEDAFWTLDRTRGRYLQDLRAHLAIRDRLTPENQALADSVQMALSKARKALMNDGLTGGERAALITQVSVLRERLEDIVGAIPSGVDDRAGDTRALQRRLGSVDQVLVSYLLSEGGSVAFVARPDTLVAVPLDTTPARVRALLDEAGAPWRDSGAEADPAFSLRALHELYRDVVAPVRPWVTDGASLVVIPDGPLAAVPFAMLTTAPSLDYATAPYLVREMAVTTELAASLVLEAEPEGTADLPLDLLAYGRSTFDGELSAWSGVVALGDLPHVDEELRQIQRHVGTSQVALNEAATEADLDAHLGTARIIHIASHAEPDPTLPLYSRIALWDGPGDADDGVVHLYELQGRSLPAELVVLSGCATARGEAQAGEGMIGLQYAVRSAGAQASLATLWPVDDEAMVTLMGGFYEGLRDGLTKERALQRAQLAYLDGSEGLAASPFFWAAPVLSGSTAPVPLDSSGLGLWWLGAGLALAGGGLAWHLRQRPVHV